MLLDPLFRFRNLLRRFSRNERGAVMVLFAMSLVAMVGMVALSSDLGRQMRMNTELQEMADAAALMAAKELDGEGDAIERAVAAVNTLRNPEGRANRSIFAQNDARLVQLRFAAHWADLENSPLAVVALPGGGAPEASLQRQAAWVQAVTDVGSAATIFAGVVGGPAQMQTMARATAGTQYVACAVQPLFMCLPPSGVSLDPGMMIRVKEQPGSQWGPGNFGLLQPPNEGNQNSNQAQITKRITRNLALSSPPICYVNALRPTQGSKTGAVREGLNVRFDIFDKNADPEIKIPPAPNVLKGVEPDKNSECVKTPFKWANNQSYPGRMPRDPCFDTASCRGNDSAFGEGGWEPGAVSYYEHHHGEGSFPEDGFETRFDMYMDQLTRTISGTEKMEPICAKSLSIGTGSPERRVIYAAMIDCVANAEWLKGNSAPSPIRAADIGKFFITEPTEGHEIYLEFVDRITANDESGKLQAIVQLYPNPQDPE
jgi:Flp pilus assembly protein TadG